MCNFALLGAAGALHLGAGCVFEDNPQVAATQGTGATSTIGGSGSSDGVSTSAASTVGVTTLVDGTSGGELPTTDGSADTDEPADTSTGGVVRPDFFDSFDRPNSLDIGNGWIEKAASTYRLQDGEIVDEAADGAYYEHLLHRGRGESARDIEISAEFRIIVESDNNEPHLVARLVPPSLMPTNPYTGYALVPRPSSNDLCIMRFDNAVGPTITQCTQFDEPSLFVLGDTYRLVLRVEGQGPVDIEGRLERQVAGPQWEVVLDVAWTDATVNQLMTAGAWGLSGGTTATELQNYVFDNFGAVFLDP